jgi:hypothetical protein
VTHPLLRAGRRRGVGSLPRWVKVREGRIVISVPDFDATESKPAKGGIFYQARDDINQGTVELTNTLLRQIRTDLRQLAGLPAAELRDMEMVEVDGSVQQAKWSRHDRQVRLTIGRREVGEAAECDDGSWRVTRDGQEVGTADSERDARRQLLSVADARPARL